MENEPMKITFMGAVVIVGILVLLIKLGHFLEERNGNSKRER